MITSSKQNFRINLKLYSSLNSSPRKPSTHPSFRFNSPILNTLNESSILNLNNNSNNNSARAISSMIDYGKSQHFWTVAQRTLTLYERNLEFYHHDERKLVRTIENEIRDKNYMHQKELVKFLTTKQLPPLRSTTLAEKLQRQLQLLNKFLQDLYQRRRIKQITIITQNLKDEQKSISQKATLQQLNFMNDNLELMEHPFAGNDYIGQYQSLCRKYGVAEPYLKSHIQIRNRLEGSRMEIRGFIEGQMRNKAKYLYFRGKRRQ